MNEIMLSVRPKWCELIASGKKKIEARKTIPKCDVPFKVYIYCTKDRRLTFWKSKRYCYSDDHSHNLFDSNCNGKVIGEFVCDYIYHNMSYDCEDSCVSTSDLMKYANGKRLRGWRISDLIIYDKPKQLSEFWKANVVCHRGTQKNDCDGCWDCEITRPPQCFCYVERRRENDLSRLHSS